MIGLEINVIKAAHSADSNLSSSEKDRVDCESSSLQPLIKFLVRWRPLVAKAIITAAKEEVR